MRIAVRPVDEVHSRAAATLLGSRRVEMVGLVGKKPPRTWGARAMRIEDHAGFDVVIGPSEDVTADGAGRVVTFAGLTGLARCLAARLAGLSVELDRTVTSETEGSGDYAMFPAPLGAVRRDASIEGVFLCPTPGSLAGVTVSDGRRRLAMVDDVLFVSGICLAAGALMVGEGHTGPVWGNASPFLELVESLGVVFAESIDDG